MNIYFFLVFLLFRNLNYSKNCCYKKNKDFNNNNEDNNDKKNKNDDEINYELENIVFKDLNYEKLKEVIDYYKKKFDINNVKNKKEYEEDHNWIKNYKFKYLDNKTNIPGYIQWTGTTCSMCSVLNALYGLKYFRDYIKKDNLEDNLDQYLKRISTFLDEKQSIDIDHFYNFTCINLFYFLKKVFNDFDNKKTIISNEQIHNEYVNLIKKTYNSNLCSHHNLLNYILESFNEFYFILKEKDGNFDSLNYSLDLLDKKNKDLTSIIVESNEKDCILASINNILYFNISKGKNEKCVENINLFKELKFSEIINLEDIIDCSKFLEKNPNLKDKLKYKLKSIIIHCGPNSKGGDYGCFRKDDNEDKYWYFQMNEEVKKYTLEEIINKKDFSGYNTVNAIGLCYELIE